MAERELTRAERGEIKKLVTKMCANYDPEYGCLPLDCPCYMLNKWWTGAYCKYFCNAVLPLNPVLEATLTGEKKDINRKTCPVCGMAYTPVTSQAYCSDYCREKGRREISRRSKQKNRRNKG